MTVLTRIPRKLATLAELDPGFRLYGAGHHRYELRPALGEDQVADFERLHGITLPEGYRRFLLEVGNGGAGPHFGLLPLEISFKNPYIELGRLAEPFPFTRPWIPKSGDTIEDKRRGCLLIEHMGCGYFVLLVVTGEERGRVWKDMTGGDGGIEPIGKDFLTWYEDWLDRHIAELTERAARREALVGQKRRELEERPDDPKALLDLAEALLAWDEQSPEARALLEKAVAGEGAELTAWHRLCEILRRAEDWPRLEETARRAQEQKRRAEEAGLPVDDTVRARLHYYLGVALSSLGRHEEAIDELQRARDLKIITRSGYRYSDVRTFQAWSLRHLGEYELARIHLRNAPRPSQRASAHVYRELGLVNANLFKYPEAVTAYRKALACYRELGSEQSVAQVLSALGDAHRAAGEPQEAERCYRESLELDPGSEEAKKGLEALAATVR